MINRHTTLTVIKTIGTGLLISACTLLTGCHRHKTNTQTKQRVITVQQKAQTLNLYYKGSIAPIKVYSVLSPVAGHIASLGFRYGDAIKQGQKLATLSASDLADTYEKQLSDYISKKDAFATAKNTYTSTQALYTAGVKNTSEVTSAESTYNNAILSLNASQHALEKTSRLLGINLQSVEKLTLKDVHAVTEQLNKKFKNIAVYASHAGVALHPLPTPQSNSSSQQDDQSNQLNVGDAIKQQQLLLSIGDLSGYATNFNVSEVDVHQFKVGQKVLVTGPAFSHETLTGKITSVASQANVDGNGSDSAMAEFAVVAKVPHVTPQQAKHIAIGMTAKINVPITTKPVISIPISTLILSKGGTSVHVKTSSGKIISQPVTVGTTLVNSVIITKGLKSEEHVVAP